MWRVAAKRRTHETSAGSHRCCANRCVRSTKCNQYYYRICCAFLHFIFHNSTIAESISLLFILVRSFVRSDGRLYVKYRCSILAIRFVTFEFEKKVISVTAPTRAPVFGFSVRLTRVPCVFSKSVSFLLAILGRAHATYLSPEPNHTNVQF